MNLEFTLESGKILVTDPCYGFNGIDYFQLIVDLDPDKYLCSVAKVNNRISKLEILKSNIFKSDTFDNLLSSDIGVDSGQAGFFDIDYYKKDEFYTNIKRISSKIICENEPFYSICCDRTLSSFQWGVIPYGVVSSSGYGDGRYRLFGTYEEGSKKIVGLSLLFIEETYDSDDLW